MTPNEFIAAVQAWRPVASMAARAVVYATTFVLGALSVWYGVDPDTVQPQWLLRACAVAAFASGPLALANISSRPK